MDGYFKLIRRIHSENQIHPIEYLPWAECLEHYKYPVVGNNSAYAKTEGIRTLFHAAQNGGDNPGHMLELAKAALTDRGLLFPQTRERFYDSPERSIKRHTLAGGATRIQADYQPSLAKEQVPAFLRQVEDFQTETFSSWKIALPALKQYLHPDLNRFQRRKHLNFSHKLAHQIEQLNSAFQNYLSKMEPSCSPYVDTMGLATYFLCQSSIVGNQPVFLDQPNVIFHLFRSPVHRGIVNHRWDLSNTVYDACVQRSLPITNQSLKLDRELFREIIHVCTEGCAQNGIDFPQEAWNALWICIEACVQCLPFQIADLFSVQYMFRSLLKFRESGYQVFDRWLEQKLSSESEPFYIPIWRTLVKKLYTLSRETGQSDLWLDRLQTYRKRMESPSTDESEIFPELESLAAKVPRNQISTVPTAEEISSIIAEINKSTGGQTLPKLKSRSRKGPLETMRTEPMKTPYKTTISTRAIDVIHTEWLLLQCVCGQAQLELMETVYLLLLNETTKPA